VRSVAEFHQKQKGDEKQSFNHHPDVKSELKVSFAPVNAL
jgi:hypothetical protein